MFEIFTKNDQENSEKRKDIRFKAIVAAVIKCDISLNVGSTKKREFHTYTQNFSEGGIKVILEEDLHSLTLVELKLYLTGTFRPIECKGQVVWSKVISPRSVEPRIFSIGIKFIELDDVSRKAIQILAFCL
jgi:c-di-GMP-binding flagellar brake protein YcgR